MGIPLLDYNLVSGDLIPNQGLPMTINDVHSLAKTIFSTISWELLLFHKPVKCVYHFLS
jgi:hypothetical protein